jgi:ABC-type transporter Mla maintaining outer membrane lipid asymmetry ATPase subunit MlaF
VILAYGDLRIEAPGSHCVRCADREEVLAAICELKPRDGAPLVVFGAEVGALRDAERQRLLRRIGFVPANGGLLSNLNGWENISLPIAYHAPQKLDGALAEVHALLEELGGVDLEFLAKLPDEMTLYERRLAAYIRALLEGPDLLVVDDAGAGLGPTKRRRASRFAEVYRTRCPGGTYVEFDG